MYLQTNSNEQQKPLISQIKKMEIAFVKIARIFHIEIEIL